jgi:hypothetical protein
MIPGEDAEDRRQQTQRACGIQARQIFERHWQMVEMLASVLLERRCLYGGQAHQLIQQTIDPTTTDWRMGAWNYTRTFRAL